MRSDDDGIVLLFLERLRELLRLVAPEIRKRTVALLPLAETLFIPICLSVTHEGHVHARLMFRRRPRDGVDEFLVEVHRGRSVVVVEKRFGLRKNGIGLMRQFRGIFPREEMFDGEEGIGVRDDDDVFAPVPREHFFRNSPVRASTALHVSIPGKW